MTYFEKVSAGKFEEINSGEVVTKAEITNGNALRKHEEEQALQVVLKGNTASVNYNPPSGNVRNSMQTPHIPRNYHQSHSSYAEYKVGTGAKGICLCVAAATLLMYYHDYVNADIVPNSYVDNTGEAVVRYLSPTIYPISSTRIWQTRTTSAVNMFTSKISLGSAQAFYISYVSGATDAKDKLVYMLSKNKPTMVVFDGRFYDQPTNVSTFHAVCAYGYLETISNNGAMNSYILCVDGDGSTQRYIYSGYLTDCFFLT